jgi:uncharacterized membrane protein (UPF0127 family)
MALGSTGLLVIGVALVCVMGLLVGVWYVGLEGQSECELTLTISMEKQTFAEGEPVNVSYELAHNQDHTINVTTFWPPYNVLIELFNSSGHQLGMIIPLYAPDLSEPMQIGAGQLINGTYDITMNFQPLAPDQYSVRLNYSNQHAPGGEYNPYNATYYFSNTLSFTVEEPPLPAHVAFALPGNETVEFDCELAVTPEEHQQGLMYRENLAQDEGMLFVFETSREVSFWMKNTLIPLDMIFMDSDGVVTNVAEADVETGVPDHLLTRYPSDGAVLYVLEVNQGLAAAHGIGPGTVATITYLN